jgi:microcin C transport system permease protein
VFARMAFGFNVSLSFALLLTLVEYLVGGVVGAAMGYFGGRFDLYLQRLIEIWSTVPFLYVVIIISSIITPNFLMLVLILNLFGWIGITYYVRAEFYREKAKDYVAAAITMGVSTPKILFRHILPNALTPLISFFPFTMVGGITSLVALDFLGFGLRPPTPSWGQMVDVGLTSLEKWWLVAVPLAALFVTLLLIVFIGEAIREAFDPKTYSRLR